MHSELEATGADDTPVTKEHRPLCASRLVWPDGEPCGLACDCDNPQPWVCIPDRDRED